MIASEIYADMSASVRRLSAVMRTSGAEVRAMRHRLAAMRWLDDNDPSAPRWWHA